MWLYRCEWLAFRPGCSVQGNVPGTHWIEGWVSLRAGLDAVKLRKYLAPAKNPTLGVLPRARRYIGKNEWVYCSTIPRFDRYMYSQSYVLCEVNLTQTTLLLLSSLFAVKLTDILNAVGPNPVHVNRVTSRPSERRISLVFCYRGHY
jgi:hypothetical protein